MEMLISLGGGSTGGTGAGGVGVGAGAGAVDEDEPPPPPPQAPSASITALSSIDLCVLFKPVFTKTPNIDGIPHNT